MNRKKLIEVIKAIKPGLIRDNVVELAEFISFNDNEIVSYNNEISISYPYDTGIKGAVKGDELLKILQSMPDDIEIVVKKEKLVISKKDKKNKITASLNLLPIQIDIWPEIPEKFEPLPDNIIEGIEFCSTRLYLIPIASRYFSIKDAHLLISSGFEETVLNLISSFNSVSISDMIL